MVSTLVLIISLSVLVVFSGVLLAYGLVNTLNAGSDVSRRLKTYAAMPDETVQRGDRRHARLTLFRLRLNSMMSMFVSEEMNLRLMSANWPITETEFLLIRVWSVVLGFGLGYLLFRSALPGVGSAFIAYLIPGIWLSQSIHYRRLKFEKQLVDALVLIKGAVRAGYSFLQSMDIVIQEMDAPVSQEFSRVRHEVGLGLPLSQALANLHARMQNDDLYLVITAVNINQQVGGNLASMVEAVTHTIRERVQLFSELRALTAQQRFSGYLLTFLPFVVLAVLFMISPTYIKTIFEPGPILCIPIGAFILILLGNIAVRVMAKVDV